MNKPNVTLIGGDNRPVMVPVWLAEKISYLLNEIEFPVGTPICFKFEDQDMIRDFKTLIEYYKQEGG